MCLFGDNVVKLFLRNKAVCINVSSLNHRLQNEIVSEFAQILGNLPQILEGNKTYGTSSNTCIFGIVSNKYLVNILSRFVFSGPGGHHSHKLVKINHSTSILINLSNHLIDSLSFGFNSKCIDGLLEFCLSKGLPLGSMDPPLSRSNKSKDCLMLCTSS